MKRTTLNKHVMNVIDYGSSFHFPMLLGKGGADHTAIRKTMLD